MLTLQPYSDEYDRSYYYRPDGKVYTPILSTIVITAPDGYLLPGLRCILTYGAAWRITVMLDGIPHVGAAIHCALQPQKSTRLLLYQYTHLKPTDPNFLNVFGTPGLSLSSVYGDIKLGSVYDPRFPSVNRSDFFYGRESPLVYPDAVDTYKAFNLAGNRQLAWFKFLTIVLFTAQGPILGAFNFQPWKLETVRFSYLGLVESVQTLQDASSTLADVSTITVPTTRKMASDAFALLPDMLKPATH